MNWYPQIGAGSIAQFPLGRTRKWRAITNWLENDERLVLDDAAADEIHWSLRYRDLTDTEVAALHTLFTASQGRFGAFGFIDPTANLLGASGDLTQPVWNAGLLTLNGGTGDPTGGTGGWTIINNTSGAQSLQQTLQLPNTYTVCFSVWLQSPMCCTVTLARNGTLKPVSAGPSWKRFYITGPGGTGADSTSVSLTLAAGQSVCIWAPQAEAQPYPSQYKGTTEAAGIYSETYFGDDELIITSTAPGLSSCDVTLISRG